MKVASVTLIFIIAAVAVVGIVALIALLVSGKKTPLPAQGDCDRSYFDGSTLQLIGYRILAFLLTTLTLGIAYPWATCMLWGWEVRHTVINGRRLSFDGKGIQLVGKYLLWCLLTVITLGIYGIWLGLGIKKWLVKHTHYEDEPDTESNFTGGAGGYLGINILRWLVTAATFGIGGAWGERMVLEWEAKHTRIGGSPLVFQGTGGQLFVKYLILGLLSPITLGIYALFFPVSYMKWRYSNTYALYMMPAIRGKSTEHEKSAVQDYARFRMNANETELAILKSDIRGDESTEQLQELASAGNPFAKYRLAQLIKEEQGGYNDEALELVKAACEARYYPAMTDYALTLLPASSAQAVSLLREAAQLGDSRAPWILKCHYEGMTSTEDMSMCAYWFRLAIEWQDENALAARSEYDRLVKRIAVAHACDAAGPSGVGAAAVVLAVVGGLVVLLAALAVFLFLPMRQLSVPRQEKAQMTYLVETPTGYVQVLDEETRSYPVDIIGTWTAVGNDYIPYQSMSYQRWTFNADGTFSVYSIGCGYFEHGWDSATGSMLLSGSYTLTGAELTMHYEGNNDYSDYSETHVIAIQGDKMFIDEESFSSMYKTDSYEEVIEREFG